MQQFFKTWTREQRQNLRERLGRISLNAGECISVDRDGKIARIKADVKPVVAKQETKPAIVATKDAKPRRPMKRERRTFKAKQPSAPSKAGPSLLSTLTSLAQRSASHAVKKRKKPPVDIRAKISDSLTPWLSNPKSLEQVLVIPDLSMEERAVVHEIVSKTEFSSFSDDEERADAWEGRKPMYVCNVATAPWLKAQETETTAVAELAEDFPVQRKPAKRRRVAPAEPVQLHELSGTNRDRRTIEEVRSEKKAAAL